MSTFHRAANGLGERLARYVASAEASALLDLHGVHCLNAFVNWIGCAIGGAQTSTVEAAVRAYDAISGEGAHRPLGRDERFTLTNAVSLDCLSSAAHAFDDTHLETIVHPTGPVAAALLGLARTKRMSGMDYIVALSVGMEVECRVGLAFASENTGAKRGWYATGLAGGIGAAAGVGRALGFDETALINAFGIAAARAGGNRGTHGSMACAYVPAIAAESGFVAAMLASSGFTCGIRALTGNSGLLALVATNPACSRALADLGQVSEAARTAFKPYPCGIVVHPVIDACLALVRNHAVSADNVRSLDLQISPATSELVANKHPVDAFEAQVSLFYWAAVTLAHGDAGIAQTAKAVILDAKVAALQDRIRVAVNPDIADDQCIAKVILCDGRTIEVSIDHAMGSIGRPMTSSDIDAKFIKQCEGLSGDRGERLLEACRNVLIIDDISTILKI